MAVAPGGRHRVYTLTEHVSRLEQDHARAKQLGDALGCLDAFAGRVRCATNMVFVDLDSNELATLTAQLADHQIRIRGPRWVLHLDVDDAGLQRVLDATRLFQPAGA